MIEVRCFRCQLTKTIVDSTAQNCSGCGGPLVPMTSIQPRSPHTPQQAAMYAAGPASEVPDEDSVMSLVATTSPRTGRIVEAAQETPQSLPGFAAAGSAVQQPKTAYCPGCGASAVVNQSGSNRSENEFQLTCGTCLSCWNLQLAAARHALVPPQCSQPGDSRQASAASLAQSPGPAATSRNVSQRLAVLTERQKEVMDLVVAGKANKQTAHILGLSEKTVERHRANLMRRLGVKNVVDLVRLHLLTTGQIDNSFGPAPATADAGQHQSAQLRDQRSD